MKGGFKLDKEGRCESLLEGSRLALQDSIDCLGLIEKVRGALCLGLFGPDQLWVWFAYFI